MRIAIVSTVPIFPVTGGNRARILGLVRNLQHLGHDVDFLYLPSRRVTDVSIEDHRTLFPGDRFWHLQRPFMQDLLYYGSRAASKAQRALKRQLRSPKGWYYGLDELYFSGYSGQIRRIVRERDFDVVFVEYVANSRVFEEISPRTLKVLDTHDSWSDRHLLYKGSSADRGYSISQADQVRGFRRADAVLAIQEGEAARFRQQLTSEKPPVFTVSHSLDVSRRVALDQAEGATFLGSAFEANVDALTFFTSEVMPLIVARRPGFRLFLAGSICNHAPSDPRIELLGTVPHFADAFARAPISLNPTRIGTGINIKLLDAMACGVPTVSSITGVRGVRHDLLSGVFAVSDGDPAGFAGACPAPL
ncbi:glycosyltransferase family 4 protein [Micromonospora sp. STR1s_5]|nr:glycosyltransferase family 4 protein [Micromonospora sp. STR1s_5]